MVCLTVERDNIYIDTRRQERLEVFLPERVVFVTRAIKKQLGCLVELHMAREHDSGVKLVGWGRTVIVEEVN